MICYTYAEYTFDYLDSFLIRWVNVKHLVLVFLAY